jgi:hypothetical protein
MNPPYFLFLLTFLLFPLIGRVLGKYHPPGIRSSSIKLVAAIFLIYDALYYFGISLRGDYIDYVIFSLQYLLLCYVVFGTNANTIYAKTAKGFGLAIIGLGTFVGAIGIFLFVVISQDYEAHRIFKTYDGRYEIRSYSFDFVTLVDTRYTFDTYRSYRYLPFEIRIDRTNFFGTKTDLHFSDTRFDILTQAGEDELQLIFKDGHGNTFYKPLHHSLALLTK